MGMQPVEQPTFALSGSMLSMARAQGYNIAAQASAAASSSDQPSVYHTGRPLLGCALQVC